MTMSAAALADELWTCQGRTWLWLWRALQTGRLVDGGADLATPPQLRRAQRCARLGVAFGAIECP